MLNAIKKVWQDEIKAVGFMERLVVDHPSLNIRCMEVLDILEGIRIGEELKEAANFFAKEHKAGCLGLAANQLGYLKRVFVAKHRKNFKIYVNPQFEPADRPVLKVEYCLSHPGKKFAVRRHRKIWAWAENQERKLLVGLEAEIFQHEMDHLEGKMV